MRFSFGSAPGRRLLRVASGCLLTCAFGGCLMVSANTPPELMKASVGTCYCHCAESREHRSCVKICESPRGASRHLASRCSKPRLRLPVEQRDAGPRFPHPGRAERADAEPTSTDSNR